MAAYLRKCGFQVGEDCFIAPADLDTQIAPGLLTIGNHVAIASGVSILPHDGSAWFSAGQPPQGVARGRVVIEDNCFIGYRAIIYPDVRIGPNSVVAAGSVVMSDVAPNTLVMGVPARPFGAVEKYREKCLARWEIQRPPDTVVEPGDTWWTTQHLFRNRELLRQRLLAVFRDRLS